MKLFGKKDDKQDDSNDKDNVDNNLNPFAKKKDNKDGDSNANANDNNKVKAESNDASSKKDFSMREFYKKAGLYEGISMKDLSAAIRDDDEEKASAVMAKMMENAVSVALTQSNKLADAKIAAVKDVVVQETKSSAEMDMAVRQMNGALPFTSHEAVAPVAKQVLTGFLEKGLSIDDAVKNTSEYYKEVAQESGQHFGFDMREKGDTSGFSNSRMQHEHHNKNNNNEESDDEDWIATLTSGNQTEESVQAAADANSAGSADAA